MRAKPVISWDQIDALRARAGLALDDIPPSAITIKQYASKYKMTLRASQTQLDRLVDQGVMCRGWGHSVLARRALFYWPKDAK